MILIQAVNFISFFLHIKKRKRAFKAQQNVLRKAGCAPDFKTIAQKAVDFYWIVDMEYDGQQHDGIVLTVSLQYKLSNMRNFFVHSGQ